MERRKFSREFKIEAVKPVRERGTPALKANILTWTYDSRIMAQLRWCRGRPRHRVRRWTVSVSRARNDGTVLRAFLVSAAAGGPNWPDAKREKLVRECMHPEQLIADSKAAAVVCDPRQSNNPIVACNDAFVLLTGYGREEIIGRNCRFLQGKRTEPGQVLKLRDAVANMRAAMVDLINYRKDGTPFRNALMIAPLFDEDGKLVYFLGSQMPIDDSSESRNERAKVLLESLTRRQGQVLVALANGQPIKNVAYELNLNERTVKMHRSGLLRSLGVRNTAEAMRIAIEAGL